MALSPLSLRLMDRLSSCPCCQSGRREENRPEDGISDNCAYEAVFNCGAAVFVTSRDEYEVGRACPGAIELVLDALQERVLEEAADA